MQTKLTSKQLDVISEFGYFQDWSTGRVYQAFWYDNFVQLAEGHFIEEMALSCMIIPLNKFFYDSKLNRLIVETEDDEIALIPLEIKKNFFSE